MYFMVFWISFFGFSGFFRDRFLGSEIWNLVLLVVVGGVDRVWVILRIERFV